MMNITIDEEVLKYVSEEEYFNVYNRLNTGENKVLYEDKNIRIRLSKVGRRIYTVKTHFGDKQIEDIVKNMLFIQAQL